MFTDPHAQTASADFLSVADYTLQLIAVAYGVFATAVDFKVEKNGKKRLSRTGILGLALLFVISVTGIQVKVWKDRKDEQARSAQKALQDEANANIARNVEMSRSLLTGLSRMDDPVEGEFTLNMILKFTIRLDENLGRKDSLKKLAVSIWTIDRDSPPGAAFGREIYSSKCAGSESSVLAVTGILADVTLSCVGRSSVWMSSKPVTYGDLDGQRVRLEVVLYDRGFKFASSTVTLAGRRKILRLEELKRLETCAARTACFEGALRLSKL